MTIFDLRSRDDIRRFIHSVAPSLAVLLISTGAVHQDVALLVMAMILAVFSDSLAHINSPDSFRRWFYPVLSALTLMLVGLGIVTNEQLTPYLAIIPVIIGGAVANKNTPGDAVEVIIEPAAAANDSPPS